jgi:hypothetical protein
VMVRSAMGGYVLLGGHMAMRSPSLLREYTSC